MAVSEERRYRLHQRLETSFGAEEATTLMELLPPVGWADVATKRDLDQQAVLMKRDLDQHAVLMKRDLEGLEERFDMRLEGLEERVGLRIDGLADRLRAESHREQRTMVFAMLAANSTLTALAFGAARLA